MEPGAEKILADNKCKDNTGKSEEYNTEQFHGAANEKVRHKCRFPLLPRYYPFVIGLRRSLYFLI